MPIGTASRKLHAQPNGLTVCKCGNSQARIRAPRPPERHWGQVVTKVKDEEPILFTALEAAQAPPTHGPCQQRPAQEKAWPEGACELSCARYCCIFAAVPRTRIFELCLLPVELWGFEPQTSCMPSSGNSSTRVRSRRSPSRKVHPGPPASRPVAVLPCCTVQPAGRSEVAARLPLGWNIPRLRRR